MITVLPVGINKVFRVPKEEWNMYCISVSFKKTPVSIRQQFAFSAEEQKSFLPATAVKYMCPAEKMP